MCLIKLKKKHMINYVGCSVVSFHNAKKAYREGDKVEMYFNIIATDTKYRFEVDGERYFPDYSNEKGYIITFTMPDHDVTIKMEWKNIMEEDGMLEASRSVTSV